MTPEASLSRMAGWFVATSMAATLVAGMAVALAAQRGPSPDAVMLDLSLPPVAAPAVAAVADPAPRAVDAAPGLPTPVALVADPVPDVPVDDVVPERPALQSALSSPMVETPALPDLAVPAPPRPKPAPEPDPVAKTKPKPKPELPKTSAQAEPAPKAKKQPKTAEPAKAAPDQGAAAAAEPAAKATSAPKVTAAAYAKAVMKKVRGTKKKRGVGHGSAKVAFTVARDGSLASVKLVQSSGNKALDQAALDHIRRSAPFPVPPAEVGRSFSFEFVGK